jgi:hypothetical protein
MLTSQQSSCVDLMPIRPEVGPDGIEVGALLVFSHDQEAALQACSKRLQEVAQLYEDK